MRARLTAFIAGILITLLVPFQLVSPGLGGLPASNDPAGQSRFLFPQIVGTALAAVAAEPGAQRSSASGVTVEITPQNLAAGAGSWDFKVVLDTHSAELNDDLVRTATLIGDKGGRYAPVTWEGAGPGGHHREGVLRFNAIAPRPESVELQIQRPGESQPRSFRWPLK